MDQGTEIIHSQTGKVSPDAELVKAINGLWAVLHETAKRLESFNEIKQQRDDYQRAITALKKEHNSIISKVENTDDLREKYENLINKHLPELEEQLNQEREKAELFEKENIELRNTLDSKKSDEENYIHAQKEIARKNHEMIARNDQIMKLREEISHLESKIIKLNSSSNTNEEEHKKLAELEADHQLLMEKYSILEDKKEYLSSENERLTKSINDSEEKVSLTIGELKEEKNDIIKEYDELKISYRSLKDAHQKFKDEVKITEEKHLELMQGIESSSIENQEKVKSLEGEIKELLAERNQNEDQIRSNLEQISKLEYKLNRLEPEYNEQKQKLKEMQNYIDRQKSTIEKQKDFEQEIEILRNQLLVKDGKINKLVSESENINDLENLLKQKEEEIAQVKSELEEKDSECWNLTNEIDALSKSSNKQNNTITKQNQLIEKLNQDLDKKELSLSNNEIKISQIQQELDNCEKQLYAINQKKKQLIDKIDKQLPILENIIEKR